MNIIELPSYTNITEFILYTNDKGQLITKKELIKLINMEEAKNGYYHFPNEEYINQILENNGKKHY